MSDLIAYYEHDSITFSFSKIPKIIYKSSYAPLVRLLVTSTCDPSGLTVIVTH